MLLKTSAAVLLAAVAIPCLAQSVRMVNVAAPEGGDGLSWETAFRDLQDGLDAAHAPGSPVEEIWVAAGTYKPDRGTLDRTKSFDLRSGLMVLGGFAGGESSRAERNWAANPTVLSGDLAGDDQPGQVGGAENSYHVLMANGVDDTGLLDGFVIQGGNADGSGVYSEGAGLRMEQSGVVVSHCIFRANISRRGGAAFDLEGSPTFAHVAFNANHATQECGALLCTVDQNIGIHPKVLGCTFVNNISASAERAPLVCISIGDKMLLRNSVFQGNTWYSEGNYNYLPPQFWGAIDWDYVCTPQFDAPYGGAHGAGEDAKLVDADGPDNIPGTDDDDLRPLPGSPVIDAGDNTSVYADRFDLDDDGDTSEPLGRDLGHAGRFYDDPGTADSGNGTAPLVDAGAFEGPAMAVIVTPSSLAVLEGTNEESLVRLSRPPESSLTVSIVTLPDGDQDLQPSPAELIFDENNWDQPQAVQVSAAEDVDPLDDMATLELSASGAVPGSIAAQELDNDLPPGTIFVNAAAVGKNNGLSWTDAFKDLQKALQVAYDSGGSVTQIWVAKGTYRPDQGTKDRTRSFILANGLALYGGFAGGEVSLGQRDWDANPTILSGDLKKNDLPGFVNYADNSFHVVKGVDTDLTAVLDGFTVTAGAPDSGAGGLDLFHDVTVTVRHCRFTLNIAGVGIYGYGSPQFEDCRFDGNRGGTSGGGVKAQSWLDVCAAAFTGCTFENNEAMQSGGGAAIWGQATLTDCVFRANALTQASAKGGGLYLQGEPDTTSVIDHCQFLDNILTNSYDEGGGVYIDSGFAYEVRDSTFTGNHATHGAALRMYSLGNQTLTFSGSVISGNTSGQNGPAVEIQANATVTGCMFESNEGGGLSASGLVQSCTFVGNTGGGLNFGLGSVRGCAFFDNSGSLWAGARAQNYAAFSDCVFSGNSASGQNARGGALQADYGVGVLRCTFEGNTCAGQGGAVAAYSYDVSFADLVDCSFIGNQGLQGGGFQGNGRLAGCAFIGNTAAQGGAMWIAANQVDVTQVSNCSVVQNGADVGGGIYHKQNRLAVTNSTIWGNTHNQPGLQDAQYFLAGDDQTKLDISYSLVQGWDGSLGGSGNSGADPLFFDTDGPDDQIGTSDDGVGVTSGSPAIDSGDNSAVPADILDADGDADTVEPLPFDLFSLARFEDDPSTPDTGLGTAPLVDRSAVEFTPQGKIILACYADMNGDDALDLFDFLAFVNFFNAADPVADCDGSGVFDLFDFLCFVNAFNAGC